MIMTSAMLLQLTMVLELMENGDLKEYLVSLREQ